jgi:hypothetical protein
MGLVEIKARGSSLDEPRCYQRDENIGQASQGETLASRASLRVDHDLAGRVQPFTSGMSSRCSMT